MEKNQKTVNRVVLIVTDSLGIGALPDAEKYGDAGSNTLANITEAMVKEKGRFKVPYLTALGLFNIEGLESTKKLVDSGSSATLSDDISPKLEQIQQGVIARLGEKSTGKDTITGHWEIGGLYTQVPFKTYPEGFPASFMKAFEERIGLETLGNYPASGTEIIEALGREHEKTGKPIIYTSADSVFQIAANTEIIPLERLYEICEVAREMLVGDVACGRVIARPYVKNSETGKRERTSDRKDYAVSPPADTLLDLLVKAGKQVRAIGKISDIFNGQGISVSVHTDNNMDGVDKTLEAMREDFSGLIFTNLVDFDSKYGHRRDPIGYGEALEAFDARLFEILGALKSDDLLMICADHGNDPIHTGWDHTREYVPLIVWAPSLHSNNLGTRDSFADIGATICDLMEADKTQIGTSFASELSFVD